jgi:hypothetical protein
MPRLIAGLLALAMLAGCGVRDGAAPAQVTPTVANYLPVVIKAAPSTPTPTLVASPTATVEPTIGPTSTPILPPPTFNNCQADPNPGAALNYPVKITAIDKAAETVTLQNVTVADTIDLTGWHMCSITGNQEHPIGGTLAPGEVKTFPNSGGPIWNNSSSDPGALYNSAGQLVSYWPD